MSGCDRPVVIPQWEACRVCGHDHWTKDHKDCDPRAHAKCDHGEDDPSCTETETPDEPPTEAA